MANEVYSPSTGAGVNASVSINDTRRMFNFGERIAELAPQQSPFFVYLSKVAKKPTDDPVFKFLEQRHQWQRRNFTVHTTVGSTGYTAGTQVDNVMKFECGYDQYGNVAANSQPKFLLAGQVVAIVGDDGNVHRWTIDEAPDASVVGEVEVKMTPLDTHSTGYTAGNKGQVIGSAFAEGSTAPDGWEDALFDREGYCQIFKTGMNLFSGTAMATRYRGIGNEFQRVWTEKLMEHKMDLEHAFLFGIGSPHTLVDSAETTGAPTRMTHGILPYTETNGKVYNYSYASSGYDAFLDSMEDFFAPESGNSGNKLVLASRKVITYLNKLGAGSFLNNSVGSSQYNLDVQSIKGSFGHQVTMVNTIFGNLHFVADPLLRGPWEDYCVAVDMKNLAYRPLVGNGISRDTYIETNIQNNDVDGRKDQIITEAGLEISLPETHAILKWSA
tara:strand:- start:2687 stop:4012 length:1326 start_codon:yes stop_codon:yes gene_type:complete